MNIKLFNIGGKVKPLVREFKTLQYKRRLAYLESTGTQHILTGLSASRYTNYGRRYVVSFVCKSTNAMVLVGGGYSSRWGVVVFDQARDESSVIRKGCFKLCWGNSSGSIVDFSPLNKKFEVDYNVKTGEGVINDSQFKFVDNGLSASLDEIVLFAGKNTSIKKIERHFIGECSRCEIYEEDGRTLARKFIPVMDFNDVPCMYDEVSGECFYNQGTGAFLYGELEG